MKFYVKEDIRNAKKSAAIQLVENHLRKLPDGCLLTGKTLVDNVKISFGNFKTNIRSFIAPELCTWDVRGNVRLYGNPKTTKAWKKQYQL